MLGKRHDLAPVNDASVLEGITGELLEAEWDSVPDGIRHRIREEAGRQSAQLLVGAGGDFDAFENQRRQAVRAYGRPDPAASVVAGMMAGYLFWLIAGGKLVPATASHGLGLTPWILAVLAAAGLTRWLPWRRRARLIRSVPAARSRWTGILEGLVRSFIVTSLNDEALNFSTSIGAQSRPRLVEAIEPRPVDSEAMTQVRLTAQSIHSGSLGVSGPRGAGKSTILQFFDTGAVTGGGRRPGAEDGGLRLVVSAPVDYEPREFIIYLFSRLCEAVPHGPELRSQIAVATRGHQEQLRYLRTDTSSWTATLTPWSLLNIARQSARQRAEQPFTLPELVEAFRGYSRDVASWQRSVHGDKARVIISIDEVDKIRDSERAEAFLNDVKAVFGVPGCLYLVSLSEDAMAGFARYTPSVRSSFDSAFDELVSVGPMTYTYSEQLLFQRVIDVPRPFIALCHVLAGGLPRDLVRTARALVSVTAGSGDKSLPDTAGALVRRELESLRQSYLRQLAENSAPGPVLAALHDRGWPGKAPFTAAASRLADAAGQTDQDPVRRLCRELVVSLSFYATALEVFAPGGLDRLVACLRDPVPGLAVIDDLAEARHAMRIDTMLAHELLVRYRRRNGIG
jgi:hypothetical protein